MAGIAASVVLIDPDAPFPGWRAVPVVVATALVVVAGSCPVGNPLTAALSAGWLVFIGKLSYGWYLIHWPLLTFVRIDSLERNTARDSLVAIVALGLAAVMFYALERPVREQRLTLVSGAWRSVGAGVATLIAVALLAGVIVRNTERFSQLDISASEQHALRENRTARNACPNLPSGASAVDCTFGDPSDAKLLLIGDSHALAVLPAVRDAAADLNVRLEVLWDTACPFIDSYRPPEGARPLDEDCRAENRARAEHVNDNRSDIAGIVVTGRATSYVRHGDEDLTARAAHAWMHALREDLAFLSNANVPVLLMHDVPRFDHQVPLCLIRRRHGCNMGRAEATEYRSAVADAERAAVALLARASVTVWDPFTSLCDSRTCFATHDREVLYRDTDHLSSAGAAFLKEPLTREIERIISRTDGAT
jgi:hypothetical protein